MKLDGITLFIIIFVGMFALVMAYTFALTRITKAKENSEKKKKALRIIGKDAIKYKDQGAKLAYKGILLFLDEKYNTAAEYFEEALKLDVGDSNRAFCYEWLAHCFIKQHKHNEYKEIRRRGAEALPYNDAVLVAYANCLADEGDFKNAEYYYNQAIKYNPNNITAYRALGFIAETRGQYEKAIEYFETLLKVSEHDLISMYEKAVCYAALGNFDEAERLMINAIAVDNENNYEKYKTHIMNIRKISEHDLFKEEGSENS